VFGREKHPVPLDRIEVAIGPTANFSGHLECDGVVKIEGIYQGSIKTVSNVVISENARVDAQIEAQNVSVSGQVKGSIVARGRLEILSTGKVWADAMVTSFLLDDGGKLHGGLKMFGTGPEPEAFDVPPPARPTTAHPVAQADTEGQPAEKPGPGDALQDTSGSPPDGPPVPSADE
jgi:cytoskeletal protein CcmA (bactofilin family)